MSGTGGSIQGLTGGAAERATVSSSFVILSEKPSDETWLNNTKDYLGVHSPKLFSNQMSIQLPHELNSDQI